MPKENSSTQLILLIARNILSGGGCYLLLGNVEVDYHFPITKQNAKMPFIPDPRYSNSRPTIQKHQQIKEDVSMTHRAPYPQEVNLPRHKMNSN
jgi:DNA polymerase-3 subunit alpha/error-prone DNA polymerase